MNHHMNKQRRIRKRSTALDTDDDLVQNSGEGGDAKPLAVEEIRTLQKLRQRKTGVDAATLAAPSSWSTAAAILPSIDDKGDQGLHMSFKHGQRKAAQEGDAEMKRYVEEELAKRLGKDYVSQDSIDGLRKKVKTLEEIALEEAVPRKGDMVSDPGVQFVAGVSEVALDIHHKLKNIEATERAKARLLSAEGDLHDLAEHDGRGNRHEFQRRQFPSQFGKLNSANRKKARI